MTRSSRAVTYARQDVFDAYASSISKSAAIPPYTSLVESCRSNANDTGQRRFEVPEQLLKLLLVAFISHLDVDEAWYRSMNPDVDVAMRNGDIASARNHFVQQGYFEGRLPSAIDVDEEWYLNEYPDVRDAIEKKMFFSAREHYNKAGYREARLTGTVHDGGLAAWINALRELSDESF